MNKLLIFAALSAVAIAAPAKNLKADFDMSHDLWWNAPEQPQVRLTLTDTAGTAAPSQLHFYVTKDTAATEVVLDRVYTVTAPAELAVDVPLPGPGFYLCHVEDDGNEIAKKWIGYEPTNVVSLPDAPADFAEFWQRAKAELAQVPVDLNLTPAPELSGKKRDAFRCTFRSWGGDTIDAVVLIPKAPGQYPAQVFYNGYGGKPWSFDADSRPDWVEMMTSVRGQFYSQPRKTYGDWIRYHLDDPDTYYYKAAFMDAVRALDVLEQLPGVDTNRMYAEGGSQGGALTLAAAALSDGRLRAIAPYIPFLSDYRDYFRIVRWPAMAVEEAAATLGMSEQQMYDNLRYFDIKNFARMIDCPVLMGIGLQDPTCPPHTNLSSYNLIESPKQLVIYPECGHTVDYSDWNPRRDEFFKKW